MAGHSHFSNVKHKKERKNSSKSKSFLKLGDKIRLIIRDGSEASYKKAYSLARENNFPKEKIDLIIKKNHYVFSKDKSLNSFSNLKLLKFDFNIMILLSLDSDDNKFFESLKKHFNSFNFSEVENNKISNLFKCYFVLKVKSNDLDFEKMLNNLVDKEVLKGVIDFSELHNDEFKFKVIASEKKVVEEVVKISNDAIKEFKIEKEFVPYIPIELLTNEAIAYFENLRNLTFEFFSSSKAFFNLL